jgi:hypothetical protein
MLPTLALLVLLVGVAGYFGTRYRQAHDRHGLTGRAALRWMLTGVVRPTDDC